MTGPRVRYAAVDGVAEIALARPPVNALDMATIDEVNAALRRAAADAAVGAVVLTSALPGRFCGGLDLAMARRSSGAELRAFLDRLYGELLDVQYRLGKPSIAAVGGAARGAGMTLAVSCDMIVAGAGATFGYSEIDVGLFPGIHCAHLPRIIGRHRAFELLLSGRAFGAAEAAGLGLVNRVVPGEALDGEARALARTFAAKSPAVMRVARAAFMRANDLDYRRTIESMAETLCALIDTPDAREGLAAFLDKRPPRWPSAAPGDGGGASG